MPKQKDLYTISEVVGHRNTKSGIEYKVHWAGYSTSQATWEPESNLQDCQEFIQEYIMNNLKSPQPRRSARLAQHPTSVIFSDEEEITEEEEEIRKSAVKVKKPKKTKTPPQKKKPKAKQDPVLILTPQYPTPSYSLRVLRTPVDRASPASYSLRSTSKINYSSDEEDNFSSVRRVVKKTPTTRMGLSEARFRNQIADIEKRKYTSSTPFSADTRSRNLDNETVETTTTTITCKTTPQEPDDDAMSGGTATTEEEEVVTIVTTETKKTVDSAEACAWHDIGWKEVALAGFIAGVGVLGYICYVSDVCGYC